MTRSPLSLLKAELILLALIYTQPLPLGQAPTIFSLLPKSDPKKLLIKQKRGRSVEVGGESVNMGIMRKRKGGK